MLFGQHIFFFLGIRVNKCCFSEVLCVALAQATSARALEVKLKEIGKVSQSRAVIQEN